MADKCQWCGKEFLAKQRLDGKFVIPAHRNPGDKYECLGSGEAPKDNETAIALTPKKAAW
jgi:hypothetical protein